MRHPWTRRPLAILALAAGVACSSHPEKARGRPVLQRGERQGQPDPDQLRRRCSFDKKVAALDDQEDARGDEEPGAAARPRREGEGDREADSAANTKDARAYNIDHCGELDEVEGAARTGSPSRPSSQPWPRSGRSSTRRTASSRRQLAEAKAAVEKEKRSVALSVGNARRPREPDGRGHDQEASTLDLTIDGQAQPYVMTPAQVRRQARIGPRARVDQPLDRSHEPRSRKRPDAAARSSEPAPARRSGPPASWRRRPGTTPSA